MPTVAYSLKRRSSPAGGCNFFLTMTAIAALLVLSRPVLAEPRGGTVVDGAAMISQVGTATNINQSSNRAIINWQGFSVGANEAVNFYQPNASSVTLNRVIGNETSIINGAINANGQVFIVNSAGVLFGQGSQVNVGGLVASTLDISNQDFMAGNYVFSGTSNAAVINQGRIRAHGGGYVALLGKTVSNEGVISARLGTVAMAAGEKITLNFAGNSLLDVTIDKGTLNALVENKRAIRANGGQVILTAKAADQVLSAQVNNTGIIQARTIGALKGGTASSGKVRVGKIKILAQGGTANIAGKLDASAPRGGNGGFIETSGAKVKIADGAVITTKSTAGKSGTWLIDPSDFNIVAGSGALTSSGIGAATLADNLANGNVSIATVAGGTENGDINVNAAVSWQADTMLTLTAHNNININEAITASGNAAGLTLNAGNSININNAVSFSGANATLAMNYGGYNGTSVLTPAAGTDYNIRTRASYSGTVLDANGNPVAMQDTSGGIYGSITFSNSANANGLIINGQTYTLIHSMSDLATEINGDPNGLFALAQSLDASGTTYGSAVVANLGGTFAGLGHTISNLKINRSNYGNVALIGRTQTGSQIRDIGMVDVDITGWGGLNEFGVAALVGWNYANISHAYSTGKVVSQDSAAGGLVGLNGRYDSPANVISDSFSDVRVTGAQSGGLIGRASNVDIYRSHATGDVASPGGSIGGLVGYAYNVSVYQSYATGALAGAGGDPNSPSMPYASSIGGLIGSLAGVGGQAIKESFATGNVIGAYQLGGLVGALSAESFLLDNSYATGDVTSYQSVSVTQQAGIGGLVGYVSGSVDIKNSHATGNVRYTGFYGDFAGGLVGNMDGNTGVIDNSYATGNVTGSTGGNRVGGLVGSGRTDIINSYASGNVTGNLTVGGLTGANSGTITNSYATGNVVGNSNNIGGLVGTNLGSVVGSHATGSVTGTGANASTGGVVGSNAGSITDSYSSGVIRGPSGLTGGIAGSSFNGATITNSWYNASTNPGMSLTNSLPCCDPGVVTGGGGLNQDQMRDIQFYANGTINQVLVERAEAARIEAARIEAERLEAARIEAARAEAARIEAARVEAAAQVAFQSGAARTGSTVANTDPSLSSAVPSATAASIRAMRDAAKIDAVGDGFKQIEQQATSEDERRERERKAAAAAAAAAAQRASIQRANANRENANRAGSRGSGPGYGATIRSIDVDGQRFNLDGGGNNSGGAPASGGGQ